MKTNVLNHSEPLIRAKSKHLDAAGVKRTPRTVGARGGLPLLLNDGSVLEVPNVIWATGYRAAFDWLDLPVLEANAPIVSPTAESSRPSRACGFIGRPFLYAFNSRTIGGVGRDAAHVV